MSKDKSEASDKPDKPDKAAKNKKNRNGKKKKNFFASWTFKVILLSFIMTVLFSLLSELTITGSGVVVVTVIILILIAVGIFFDAVGVAVTSCDAGPLTAMASRRVAAAKTALRLINNAEKVSSFCSDVIGDICGIVGGACVVALATKISEGFTVEVGIFTVFLSAVLAAATIGGKSYFKNIAIKNSRDVVMFAAKILYFFRIKRKK